ncbi:MAG: TonB-dependent receptor plug domain-containing protein [Syntrophobacteraceae bacterium]
MKACRTFNPYGAKSFLVSWFIGMLTGSVLLALTAVEVIAETGPAPADLTALTIEELMNVSITSVSKRPMRMSDAAAAVFVITQDDIRRSGATSVPELLRMVPGLEVSRIDASKWAISSRGFSSRFANKLLVLFDGRTVYNPLFSGVFWEHQNYILEDIERIEVIRGPGASLWGANAVNGVINIITKKAKDTQGGLVSAAGGSHEAFGGIRYGGKIDDSTYYRAYSKYYDHRGFPGARGVVRSDAWNYNTSGFRLDRDISPDDSVTVQGDFQQKSSDETYFLPSVFPPFSDRFDSFTDFTGGNLLARWNRTLSATSNFQVQAYYDRGELSDRLFGEKRNTFDIETQHQFKPSGKQTVIWGLGYRFEQDHVRDSFLIHTVPDHTNNLFSAFVQDEISLDDKVTLTLGSRFEHNTHTGFEIQPNVRLAWTPDKRRVFWTAISRAVRTPSWAEEDLSLDVAAIPPSIFNPLPTLVVINGNPDLKSEELYAFEFGHRFMPFEGLSIDITGFYNIYSDLGSNEVGEPFVDPFPIPHIVLPLTAGSGLHGDTYGFELAADYQVRKWWRLQAAYTFLQMDLEPNSNSTDTTSPEFISGSNPHHQFSIRSAFDLPHKTEFDLWLRFVDALPALNVGSYTTLNARLAWRPVRNLELSIVGQNLLDKKHVEMSPDFLGTIEAQIERSVYGKVVWRF